MAAPPTRRSVPVPAPVLVGSGHEPLTPLWRGLAVFRVLTYAFVVGVQIVYVDEYARPVLSWVLVGTVGVWTVLTVVVFSTDRGRRPSLAALDLVVTLALLSSTRLVQTSAQVLDTTPTLTTLWTAAPVITIAVLSGARAGAATGVGVAAASIAVNGHLTGAIARDSVILLLLGLILGVVADAGRRSHAALEQALRAEAALAERERLARAVHDGVLQVLAYVQRQGSVLGEEAAELARLAGEQEVALRALITAGPARSTGAGAADLRTLLQNLIRPGVAVSVPPTPVLLPAETAEELAHVVRAALDNTALHAGPGAAAWVLLEDLGDEVVLSVRDDGVGIAEGRLRQAQAQGRVGVARSIRGRVAELGGRITLDSAPGAGTGWEIRVSRRSRRG